MASSSVKKRSDNLSVSSRFDRKNKIRLSRRNTLRGFQEYTLENLATKQKLVIPRHLFDRFRSTLLKKFQVASSLDPQNNIRLSVEFGSNELFSIKSETLHPNRIIIQSFINQDHDEVEFSRAAIPALCKLLYIQDLEHPNDVLNRIISYHKQFLFSFEEGSESLNSQLTLRKKILSETLNYVPKMRLEKHNLLNIKNDNNEADQEDRLGTEDLEKEGNAKLFKSKLAERGVKGPYTVDFTELFPGSRAPMAAKESSKDSKKPNKDEVSFSLPLMAQEVKHLSNQPFVCDLNPNEANELRNGFFADPSHTYHIGIEVCDAIFKNSSGKIKTFRFPLYHLPVKVKESGRQLIIEPEAHARLYLNHMALAYLFEKFGPSNGMVSYGEFFRNLLNQQIDFTGRSERIHLSRMLPFDNELYQKQREILLGFPGEKGKGGLFSNLKVEAVECDLESTLLYKVPMTASVLSTALAKDLQGILQNAYNDSGKFYSSLLGKFLSPEKKAEASPLEKFSEQIYIPGALPKSTRRIMKKLDDSDLVLLEGPPGTGKTFTIMNLLIHSICAGQKLLIVSDQSSAIDALTEKVTEYLTPSPEESNLHNMEQLWQGAIKVMSELPNGNQGMNAILNSLQDQLALDKSKDHGWIQDDRNFADEIKRLDEKKDKLLSLVNKVMLSRVGPNSESRKRIAPKRLHATTDQEINATMQFLKFIGSGQSHIQDAKFEQIRFLLRLMISHREKIAGSSMRPIFDYLRLPSKVSDSDIANIESMLEFTHKLLKAKPRSMKAFYKIAKGYEINAYSTFVRDLYSKAFPKNASKYRRSLNVFKSIFSYPLRKKLSFLKLVLETHRKVLKLGKKVKSEIWNQYELIHDALSPSNHNSQIPLILELTRYATRSSKIASKDAKVRPMHELLIKLSEMQSKRDELVRNMFIQRLIEYRLRSVSTDDHESTNKATRILSIIDNMKNHSNLTSANSLYQDLRQALKETFPVWICRKQAVPFLFPCEQNSFDLIIVDEATQCRVDDAIPLLYRGKKLMVVGDDQQTVLQKHSDMDDYLFSEYQLEEHLRNTQAQAVKGGGSNIFALVKSIKQASVMLDEHYRCPPDIISYSNKYVYGDELKVMKWTPAGSPRGIVVDYSEENKPVSKKPTGGKYKAIETDMVDRFYKFVEKSILQIEKETGKKIDLTKDVAICYFLLKNEPYMKDAKAAFLDRMKRGDDVLDGAGAALQGKERDYIFYYWDVTRANMLAFRQGDERDKRKGELNVLMSRPKKRAYHFLHKNFKKLDHSKASITDYLWKKLGEQQTRDKVRDFVPRTNRPTHGFYPWKRGSGQLMHQMVEKILKLKGHQKKLDVQYGVPVGDISRRIDLMIKVKDPNTGRPKHIGIVDLAGFDATNNIGIEVADYYFQLKRSQPGIEPIFLYMHELADEKSPGFKKLMRMLFPKQSKIAAS